jgi:hypothetical protein
VFALLFFFNDSFPDKPIGFDHSDINSGMGFGSGGYDDLFYVDNVLGGLDGFIWHIYS